MKISIVTLSYNQRAYLQEALDSVIRQEYPELDYILVDPGSTDGSRELIQSYSSRISRTIFEPDCGAADGLNKGFSLATGEVFGFLNADDLLMPGSLQRVADFYRQNPKCDMALGNGHIINGEGKKTRHIKARDFTVGRYLHGGARWLQQSVFFRREAFLRSPRFNPENRSSWDGELFVNMVNQGARVGYIDADLSCFRIYGTSITGSGRLIKACREDHSRIFREISGHAWRQTDEALRLLYRGEGLMLRVAAWIQNRAQRNMK
jgi:glycosyltransferase involved in cell wall biosynthesis